VKITSEHIINFAKSLLEEVDNSTSKEVIEDIEIVTEALFTLARKVKKQ
jgi:hypothetical protein